MAVSTHIFGKTLPLGSLIGILLLVNFTDPTKSVASILLVFLCLYIFCTSVLYGLLRYVYHRLPAPGYRRDRSQLSVQRAYYIASALAFVPVGLIAMQSLNQVRLFDLGLILVLVSLLIFYIVKRTS